MNPARAIMPIIASALAVALTAGVARSQTGAGPESVAQRYYEAGDLEKSLEVWNDILSKNPGNIEAQRKAESIVQEKYARDVEKAKSRISETRQKIMFEKSKGKSLSLDWDDVDGATRYEVTVLDAQGREALKKSVEASDIRFALPPGDYRLKVAAINIFGRLGSETEWRDFRIELKEGDSREKHYNYRFRLSAGLGAMTPMSPWSDLYEQDLKGVRLSGGVFGTTGIFRHAGIEAFGSMHSLEGMEAPGVQRHTMEMLIYGAGLCVATHLDYPLNLFLRAGGGAAKAEFSYTSKLSGNEFKTEETKPYYCAGLSVEYQMYGIMHFELGAEYSMIMFSGEPMKSLHYYLMVGVHY